MIDVIEKIVEAKRRAFGVSGAILDMGTKHEKDILQLAKKYHQINQKYQKGKAIGMGSTSTVFLAINLETADGMQLSLYLVENR